MMNDNWEKNIDERLHMQGLKNHINVLENEMDILASRLKPTETGHLHTTIHTLQHRIEELQKELDGEKQDENTE